jgi:acyl carrier protein
MSFMDRSSSASADMLEKLIALLRDRLDVAPEELNRDASLEELGLDSVELAFVFSHLERDTGLDLADAEVDISLYETLGGVADLLSARAHPGRA